MNAVREIGPDEADKLYDCLEALAAHHNRRIIIFSGRDDTRCHIYRMYSNETQTFKP